MNKMYCGACVYGEPRHAEFCHLTNMWLVAKRKEWENEREWVKRCAVIKNVQKASIARAEPHPLSCDNASLQGD